MLHKKHHVLFNVKRFQETKRTTKINKKKEQKTEIISDKVSKKNNLAQSSVVELETEHKTHRRR